MFILICMALKEFKLILIPSASQPQLMEKAAGNIDIENYII